jgi:hypothetical protein
MTPWHGNIAFAVLAPRAWSEVISTTISPRWFDDARPPPLRAGPALASGRSPPYATVIIGSGD